MPARKKIAVLVLHHANESNLTMSYHYGWLGGFASHPQLKASFFNVTGVRKSSGRIRKLLYRVKKLDALVVLHSVFSNSNFLTGYWLDYIKSLNLPAVYFMSNEYKFIPEKIALASELKTVLFITQSDSPQVKSLYQQELPVGCKVISIPHAGLDDNIFRPEIDFRDRPIDLGFRACDEAIYFGHQERRAISNFFLENAERFGLKVDIDCGNDEKRFNREEYACFLNRCRGQLGTEAGPDLFETTDELRLKINSYITENPEATLSEIRDLFFTTYDKPRVPLKIISGRNMEAAGTKSVQVLFEGNYNGILKADEHYIALKKDFSNSGDVLARFRDDDYCREMVDRTYELVKSEYTYQKLIGRLVDELLQVI